MLIHSNVFIGVLIVLVMLLVATIAFVVLKISSRIASVEDVESELDIFNCMNETSLKLRGASNLSEYKQRYLHAIQRLSASDAFALTAVVSDACEKLNIITTLSYKPKLRYKIVVLDDPHVEFNFPHTLRTIIALPKWCLELIRVDDYNTLLEIAIHELIHIAQKANLMDWQMRLQLFKKVDRIPIQLPDGVHEVFNPDSNSSVDWTTLARRLIVVRLVYDPANTLVGNKGNYPPGVKDVIFDAETGGVYRDVDKRYKKYSQWQPEEIVAESLVKTTMRNCSGTSSIFQMYLLYRSICIPDVANPKS